MSLLNNLPERFDSLMSAMYALGDEKTFTFEFVKSQHLQEEQRNQQRVEDALKKHQEKTLTTTQSKTNCAICSSRGGSKMFEMWKIGPYF